MKLTELIIEKAKRQSYQDKVLTALWDGYRQIDINSPCMQCTTAGKVYSFLADKLALPPGNSRWMIQVRDMLISEKIIQPHLYQGIMYWKGLAAKDPTQDLAKAEHLRQYRHQYRKSRKDKR